MAEQLDVYLGLNRLGTLSLQGREDRYELEYASSWLGREGFAISPHLKPGACETETLKRFLANLLPEGKWLDELSISQQISKNNIFGLIAVLGLETAGALTFRRKDGKPAPTTFRPVSKEELQQRLAERRQRSIINWDGKPRLSVAGVQDKLPILTRPGGKMGFGEGDLASTHILKFDARQNMHLVINEYICMELARLVRLPVAEVSLLRFGEPVLAVKRFDRQWAGDRIERLHLIDGCQLLDLPPTYKYERPFGKSGEAAHITTGASLPALFAACKQCRIPALAMKQMLDWALFQLLIGNCDAHAKNISFFINRNGMDIAPAYDLINVGLYGDQYDQDLAMAIGDAFAFKDVHVYQLAEMCEECDLPQRQVALALQKLCNDMRKAMEALTPPQVLTEKELDFSRGLIAEIRNNTDRFSKLADELPHA